MDDVLLEVRNQKEGFCAWSLIATTSHILTLTLTTSLRLMIESLSSFVSNPYLSFLSSTYISSQPTQCTPWFASIIEPHCGGPANIYSFALLVLKGRWFWASTLNGVSPPLSHVMLISHVTYRTILFELSKEASFLIAIVVAPRMPSCILHGALTTLVNHQDWSNTQDSVVHFCAMSVRSLPRLRVSILLLSKRISSTIASTIDSVWKFILQYGMLSSTLEFDKIPFSFLSIRSSRWTKKIK
jgi:hypothetical protein